MKDRAKEDSLAKKEMELKDTRHVRNWYELQLEFCHATAEVQLCHLKMYWKHVT